MDSRNRPDMLIYNEVRQQKLRSQNICVAFLRSMKERGNQLYNAAVICMDTSVAKVDPKS